MASVLGIVTMLLGYVLHIPDLPKTMKSNALVKTTSLSNCLFFALPCEAEIMELTYLSIL